MSIVPLAPQPVLDEYIIKNENTTTYKAIRSYQIQAVKLMKNMIIALLAAQA